jgi:hypothetical protein
MWIHDSRRRSEMRLLWSVANRPDQSLNNDPQAKCHECRRRHTSRRIRNSVDASSVVRAADPSLIEKGLKLLNGKCSNPLVAGSNPAGGAIDLSSDSSVLPCEWPEVLELPGGPHGSSHVLRQKTKTSLDELAQRDLYCQGELNGNTKDACILHAIGFRILRN